MYVCGTGVLIGILTGIVGNLNGSNKHDVFTRADAIEKVLGVTVATR